MKDKFATQFKLFNNQYRDNNNFISVNDVKTQDSRFNIFKKAKDFTFVTIEPYPAYISGKYLNNRNVSEDNGKSYKQEISEVVYATYYYMADERVEHQRIAFNVWSLLS